MSHADPTTAADLVALWNRAWAADSPPDLAAFLARFPAADRDDRLAVLCLDQRRRWERGDRRPAEAYLADHPDLAADPEAVVDLLYHEYVLRREAGEAPDPGDLAGRFPGVAETISRQLQVDELLGWDASPADTVVERAAAPTAATVGRYPVLNTVGAGGQAVVYRGLHPTLNREVVIKLGRTAARPAEREALVQEGRLLAELDHPNLVRVLDLDFHGGCPFVVMDYVRGQPLQQAGADRRYPPREAAAVVAALARAADHAHRRGVVHRDVKPKNVLIDEAGRPRLIDFGLARLRGGWQEPAADPEAGLISGTVEYMPPEQAAGDADRVGPRSDVFGLGGVLFFLLTGKPPLAGSTLAECLTRARHGEWDAAALRQPGVPPRLAAVCRRALAARPEDRHASAAELADELERYARPPRRLWAAAVGVGILAVALAAVFLRPTPKPVDGPPVAPAVVAPKATLRVGVWNDSQGRYIDLPGPTVATRSKLRIEAEVPPGVHAALFYLDSAGTVELLAEAKPAADTATLRFPPDPKQSATVGGPPGTEVVLLVTGSAPVSADDVRAALTAGGAWPALPDISVLQLTGASVAVLEKGRDFALTEQDDPEGRVTERLKAIGKRLGEKAAEVHALAFKHRE